MENLANGSFAGEPPIKKEPNDDGTAKSFGELNQDCLVTVKREKDDFHIEIESNNNQEVPQQRKSPDACLAAVKREKDDSQAELKKDQQANCEATGVPSKNNPSVKVTFELVNSNPLSPAEICGLFSMYGKVVKWGTIIEDRLAFVILETSKDARHDCIPALYKDINGRIVNGAQIFITDIFKILPKISITNLSSNTNEAQVRELFAEYGTVDRCRVIRNRSYGWLSLDTTMDVNDVIKKINGQIVDGKPLCVVSWENRVPFMGKKKQKHWRSNYNNAMEARVSPSQRTFAPSHANRQYGVWSSPMSAQLHYYCGSSRFAQYPYYYPNGPWYSDNWHNQQSAGANWQLPNYSQSFPLYNQPWNAEPLYGYYLFNPFNQPAAPRTPRYQQPY